MSKDQTLRPGQYVVANVRTVTELDTGSVRIAGVANDASVTDTYGTRVKFTQRALDGFKSNPVLLFNHDTDNPIGTVTSVEYRGTQLWAEAEIHPEARTPSGASIAALTRSGVLRAFSVRFDEYTEARSGDHTAITADAMDELSVVTLPSNKPSLFSMRSRGVELHGAEELLPEESEAVPLTVRLHPDDLAELARQIREPAEAVPPTPEPTPPVPEPEAPAAEAVAELSLDEVRSAIRQAAQSVTSAQPG